MYRLACLALAALVAAGCASTPADVSSDAHEHVHVSADDPDPERNAQWLQQLAGEWTCTGEAWMAPDAEPMTMESTETIRTIGDQWIVAESHADFQGEPFHSVMALGYDPNEGAFVGTWIDSIQTTLWVYRGTLDAERKTLTLEAEGPTFGDPNVTTSYRDALTIVSPDHKRMTSSAKMEDGTWVTFMKADYKRK